MLREAESAVRPQEPGRDRLVAGLLNPPQSSTGNRSRNAVVRAGQVLGYKSVEVVNLYAEPTDSIVELGLSESLKGWLEARAELTSALKGAADLLGGWVWRHSLVLLRVAGTSK